MVCPLSSAPMVAPRGSRHLIRCLGFAAMVCPSAPSPLVPLRGSAPLIRALWSMCDGLPLSSAPMVAPRESRHLIRCLGFAAMVCSSHPHRWSHREGRTPCAHLDGREAMAVAAIAPLGSAALPLCHPLPIGFPRSPSAIRSPLVAPCALGSPSAPTARPPDGR